jgi:hypothetical protein
VTRLAIAISSAVVSVDSLGPQLLLAIDQSSPTDELAYARAHFFLPRRFEDPFWNSTTIEYVHDLLVLSLRDAVLMPVVLKAHAELVTAPFMNAMAALMLGSLGIRREAASPVVAVKERRQATRLRPPHLMMLRDALVEAFSFDEMSEVVRTRLGRNIESVSSFNQPFTDQIFSLIRSADQQGWVLDLVLQAYYARPNNELLARLPGARASPACRMPRSQRLFRPHPRFAIRPRSSSALTSSPPPYVGLRSASRILRPASL